MKRIMFVDDDHNVGQAMRRMLRPMRKEWDTVFCEGGEEALATMDAAEEPFDIVISDMHMPGMHGAEFLSEVMRRHPETIRFALSGSAGSDTMIKTASIVHQYLMKPLDPPDLLRLIHRAFMLREQLHNSALKKVIHDMGGVPSVPALYQEVLREMHSPNPSVAKIGGIIEKDAGMSAKVLQIVNSAGLGLRQRVTSVMQAATLLGLNNLRNLVLMAEAFYPAEKANLPKNFGIDALWNHCLNVAIYAKKIALSEEEVDRRIADDSFTAGLLHDMGQIVLATKKTEEFGEALRRSREERVPLFDIEVEMFGANHAEIGGYLLELWGLPDPVVEAIAFHAFPTGCPEEEFTALTALHVANYFCEDDEGCGHGGHASEIDSVYLERLEMGGRIEYWYDECHASFDLVED